MLQSSEIKMEGYFLKLVDLVGGWYFNHELFKKSAKEFGLEQPDTSKGICIAGDKGLGKTFVFRVFNSILRLIGSPHFQWLNVWDITQNVNAKNLSTLNIYVHKNVFVDDFGRESKLKYSSKEYPNYAGEELIIARSNSLNYHASYLHCTTNYFTSKMGCLSEIYRDITIDRLRMFCNIISIERYVEQTVFNSFRGLHNQAERDVWVNYYNNEADANYLIRTLKELMDSVLHPDDLQSALISIKKEYTNLRKNDPFMRVWRLREKIKNLIDDIENNIEQYSDETIEKLDKQRNIYVVLAELANNKKRGIDKNRVSPTEQIRIKISDYLGVEFPKDDQELIHNFYTFWALESWRVKNGEEEFKDFLRNKLNERINKAKVA